MHNSMFSAGHDRAEVKAALNAHMKRDALWVRGFDLGLALCVGLLVRDLPGLTPWLISGALICGVSGMRYFIDQSNRNFFLHRLDWEEARSRLDPGQR